MKTHLSDSVERKHYVIKKVDTLECKVKTVYAGTYECKSSIKPVGHTHNFLEIMFIISGKGNISISNKKYTAKKGDLIIYYPNKQHGEWVDKNQNMQAVFFSIKWNNQMAVLFENSNSPELLKTGQNYNFFLKYMTELLTNSQNKDELYSDKITNCISKIILLKILQISPHKKQIYSGNEIVAKTKEYIDNHFCEKINLAQLNEKLFVSDYYISRVFKEYLGMTPGNYIIEKRIELAKELLATTNLSTSEIAQKVGYNDLYHFLKLFKKEVGIRPSLYKKQTASI